MADAVPMTQEQLTKLIGDAVSAQAEQLEAKIGPAVAAALEPLTKSQTESNQTFVSALKALRPSEEALEDATAKIDKGLGPFKYGRKARAMALATIENNSSDPGAA